MPVNEYHALGKCPFLVELGTSVNQDREVVIQYLGDCTTSCHVESAQLHWGRPPEMLDREGLILAIHILDFYLRPIL